MRTLKFFTEFLSNPVAVSSVVPSSKYLARCVVAAAGVANANHILELGPGTGAITGEVLRRKPKSCSYLGVELNGEFVATLREQYPEADFVQGDARKAAAHLATRGIEEVDCLVSGLPFASFDSGLQDDLLDAIESVMAPGARFVTFTYLSSTLLPKSKIFKVKLEERFGSVDRTPVVLRNLPPAFAYQAVA